MFNSLTGAVGFAMHEDRLARAERNLRLIEAEGAKVGRSSALPGSTYREAVANILMTLATHLAPTVVTARTRTGALAH